MASKWAPALTSLGTYSTASSLADTTLRRANFPFPESQIAATPVSVQSAVAGEETTMATNITANGEVMRMKCLLTVELSGVRTDVCAWEFIYHASAPAIC